LQLIARRGIIQPSQPENTMYAKILKGESLENVQKVGNGNNQYQKNFGGGGKGKDSDSGGQGGDAAVDAIKKLIPNAGSTSGSLGKSVSSNGQGHVPEVHKALTDAGFKKGKTTEYENGGKTTEYKHKDGSKAKINEHPGRPDSKHNKEPSHDFHVSGPKSVKKAALGFDYQL
jgi:hypothetical protein